MGRTTTLLSRSGVTRLSQAVTRLELRQAQGAGSTQITITQRALRPVSVLKPLQPVSVVLKSAVTGPRGPQGLPGPDGNTLPYEAGTSILAYKAVTTDADGRLGYASSSTPEHMDQVLGLSVQAGLEGAQVQVKTFGQITNTGWNWTPGQPLFLGLNGEITANPNTGVFCLAIGYAQTQHQIFIRIGRGIMRESSNG